MIPISLYEETSKMLDDQMNLYFPHESGLEFIAGDGLYVNGLDVLKNDGFQLNPKGNSVGMLITGLWSISRRTPIALQLEKHKNERESIIDMVNDKEYFKNKVLVFDRGYESMKLFKFLDKNNIKYICRLTKNGKDVLNLKNNKSDYIDKIITETTPKTKKIKMVSRVIRYKNKNKAVHLRTNIFDKNIDFIKLYNQRWEVEEYFKHIRYNSKLNKLDEKKEENIRKTLLCNLIVSQITCIFDNFKKGIDKKILNKSKLTKGIYNEFLYRFLNGNLTMYFLDNFMMIYIQYITSSAGKSFERIGKRPISRDWYRKGAKQKIKQRKNIETNYPLLKQILLEHKH
jgi:hypothetical protein